MSTDQISTVGELMDYLATQPRDRKVILEKGADGYSPLAGAGEAMYEAESAWSGEVHPTPEQMASPENPGYTDEDAAPDGAERVVVLGPVN